MASFLRESTDSGAPILMSKDQGSMNMLLKAVLVDGYGSQSALGWSVAFEDLLSYELVLRADSGTRFFIKIDDNQSQHNYRYSLVTAYETMTDINTGLMPCPLASAGEYRYLAKSLGTTTNGAVPWKIIGDDKGFWLLTQYGYPDYTTGARSYFWAPHYIGDYTSLDITNTYNFMTILSNSDGQGYFLQNNNNCCYVMRDPLTQESGAIKFFPETWHKGYTDSTFGNNLIPSVSPINGQYIYEPTHVFSNNNPHGNIPGLLSMLWSCADQTTNYIMTEQEMQVFSEVSSNKEIITLPIRRLNRTDYYLGIRISIIIGEGFRNAY